MDGSTDTAPEWEPFNRPLFENPKVRDLSRVGVIDIGSNSVRLVVFDGAARSPAYFFNEKVMCALGAGLGRNRQTKPQQDGPEPYRRYVDSAHQPKALAYQISPLSPLQLCARPVMVPNL